jgi:hypothetical protein
MKRVKYYLVGVKSWDGRMYYDNGGFLVGRPSNAIHFSSKRKARQYAKKLCKDLKSKKVCDLYKTVDVCKFVA